MDHIHPHGSQRAAFILVAAVAMLLLAAACGSNQADIDAAVNATRTADQAAANAVATSVAATLAAAPRPTAAPTAAHVAAPTAGPATGEFCEFPFSELEAISTGYLSGGRFMVTLQNPNRFLLPLYNFRINGIDYPCTPIAGQPENRVYCIGRPRPPVGDAVVQLYVGDLSCRIVIPFDTISVPPVPEPTSAGNYP